MKPAYILQDFPCLSETFILREILALRQLGTGVEVFALRDPSEPLRHAAAAALASSVFYADAISARAKASAALHWLIRRPARVIRMAAGLLCDTLVHPRAFLPLWGRVPAALAIAREIGRRDASHIHAHFAYLPADVARLAAILLGLPFSVSAHARDVYSQPAAVLNRRLRGASAVMACSHDGIETLRRKLGRGHQLHYVPHGVPIADFEGPHKSDGRTLLAVGRLTPKKGLVHLVRACGILRRQGHALRCRIVGDGPERGRLAAAVEEEGVEDVVELAGAMAQEQLPAAYRASDVLVHPSVTMPDGDRDGVPNVILEAMAARLPVVATRVGGIAEAVRDGVTGILVEPGSPGQLAASLVSLLGDPGRRREMGDAGHQLVTDMHDTVMNAERLRALFAGAGDGGHDG